MLSSCKSVYITIRAEYMLKNKIGKKTKSVKTEIEKNGVNGFYFYFIFYFLCGCEEIANMKFFEVASNIKAAYRAQITLELLKWRINE